MEAKKGLPPGFKFITQIQSSSKPIVFYQISVLAITFVSYASFHASRKPPSIVKSVLGPEIEQNRSQNSSLAQTGWAPFDGKYGTHRLGELDVAFLLVYSLGMYFSGHLADRFDLRLFLSFGMLASGFSTILFGMGYWWNVHKFAYFFVVQIVCGLFQSTGWPSVVAVVGNWFGKSKRGLIMGIWNSHTSVGNIIGSLVASSVLEFGWGWSFVLPGIAIALVGILVFLFLVVDPEDAGFASPSQEIELNSCVESSEKSIEVLNLNSPSERNGSVILKLENGENLGGNLEKIDEQREGEDIGLIQLSNKSESNAIGFIEAWKLPGVAPYAFCLFFSKLVAYTFLYWLPFYLRHTAVAGEHLSHKTAGILSTAFDVGGVLGGILAGYVSDKLDARAITSIVFFFFSIPALILYRTFGSFSMYANIGLLLISGLFVNGPYSLITTAVATDLGTQSSTNGNSRALATVTAIIDGTGSVGAALGPLLTGYISSRGWNSVFLMLILAAFFAGLLLVFRARDEVLGMIDQLKSFETT